MQTTRFLDEHPDWQQISVVNTAIAAKKVLEENDISQAAVCSSYAAQVHGLSVLVDGINDDADNFYKVYCCDKPESIFKGCVKDQYPV